MAQAPSVPFEARLAKAKSVLAAVRELSSEDGREALVAHWESQVEAINLEMARSRPVERQLQSAVTKVEKTREALASAAAALHLAKEALESAVSAEEDATKAHQEAQAELHRCGLELSLSPPAPAAQSGLPQAQVAGLFSSLSSSLHGVALPPDATNVLNHLASLLCPQTSTAAPLPPASWTGSTSPVPPAPVIPPMAQPGTPTAPGVGLAPGEQQVSPTTGVTPAVGGGEPEVPEHRDASRSPRREAEGSAGLLGQA